MGEWSGHNKVIVVINQGKVSHLGTSKEGHTGGNEDHGHVAAEVTHHLATVMMYRGHVGKTLAEVVQQPQPVPPSSETSARSTVAKSPHPLETWWWSTEQQRFI